MQTRTPPQRPNCARQEAGQRTPAFRTRLITDRTRKPTSSTVGQPPIHRGGSASCATSHACLEGQACHPGFRARGAHPCPRRPFRAAAVMRRSTCKRARRPPRASPTPCATSHACLEGQACHPVGIDRTAPARKQASVRRHYAHGSSSIAPANPRPAQSANRRITAAGRRLARLHTLAFEGKHATPTFRAAAVMRRSTCKRERVDCRNRTKTGPIPDACALWRARAANSILGRLRHTRGQKKRRHALRSEPC